MGVEFGLLGEVTVRVDGRTGDLGPAKQRCVLAALAVDAPRLVPADRLVERVWGVDVPRRGRKTLYSHVSRLRQALSAVGAAEVVSRAGGYALLVDRPDQVVDVHRFRDLCARARGETDDAVAARVLTEALLLWRGPAMTGLDGEWAETERALLEGERLAAQHDLADTRLRLGEGGDLVVELAGRAAAHPLDERVAGQYLLALHQAGRTADALEHYRRLRERLVEELGTDPGPALRDLHRRVLAADPGLAGTPADGSAAVPLQLPTAPGPFTGRVTELAELDRALAPDGAQHAGVTAVISAIGGTGGIGKTWLALTWAHRNLHRFPDGQLFVNLRGFGPDEPKQAAGVLADFLTALGVDRDHQPQDLDARAALYRTRTAGKHLLVLLDNAATTEQVVPLLPGGTTCTVLITSRHRLPALLTRHGALPVHLDVLTEPEARTLLDAALGDARATAERAVTELVGLCGGFPLALGLIAARIRTRPALIEDVLADLRDLGLDALDSDDPDASLPAVLSWSLRHLTAEQRTVFGLLGIAPGPDTDLPAATSLTGLPARDARAALRALADTSLVADAPGGRYAMPDLVRAYAATTAVADLPEPARRAALERVVDFYLHTAHTAALLLSPHRPPVDLTPPVPGVRPQELPDPGAALAWLDVHHPHLLAAQRTAAAHHGHEAVWQLAWTLTTFHARRGHHDDELAVWQTAADAAAHLPDPTPRTLAHRLLGRAWSGLGLHEEATGHLREALTLADQHGDPVEQAHTHYDLARARGWQGDDRQALEHARRALDLYRALDQPVDEARTLNVVGWFAARLGDHETAAVHCEAALVLNRRHHDLAGEAATLGNLGYFAHRTGRHEHALDHYRTCLVLLRQTGDAHHEPVCLEWVGQAHAALDRPEQAREAWLEALDLYERQHRTTDAARTRRQLEDLDRAPA
ncbi:AfsR/SARP family transcriptional regulator [Umezawaea sp.]|uniref:AfsR/SARP family transcriptional regulator n=1 Tax=Umezawaea sp. TaxID=1955258 RepID=UPI002ED2B5C1